MIGISGMFKRIPIGETRWNRKATSGSAASQTTVEATTPSTRHARRPAQSLPPSGLESSLELVERRAGTADPAPDRLREVRRDDAHAGGTSQTSAPIARNESWQPTSKRIQRIDRQRRQARPGTACWRAGPSRSAIAARQNVAVMTVERTTEGAGPTSRA